MIYDPILPRNSGGLSRVIQGYFPGGPPRIIQPAPAPRLPAARSTTIAAQPSVRPGQPTPSNFRAEPHAARLNPAMPARPMAAQPMAAQPILPKTMVPPTAPARAGDAIELPAGFTLKPRGSGQPLPETVQKKMESFFKTSFSDVRVHVGPEAASIGAFAFTHGPDLYFAPGQYSPETFEGQRLLGHELTHVVQQRTGKVRNPLGSGIAVVQDAGLEAEAERMGQRAATHSIPNPPILRSSVAVVGSVGVQRSSSSGARGMTPMPILPANSRHVRPPVQMRDAKNRSSSPPPRLNPTAIQPSISALLAHADATRRLVPAPPRLVRPTVPGQAILPASSHPASVLQRDVNWNALSHSQGGAYGLKARDHTKLYGLPNSVGPEPTRLYHETTDRDSSVKGRRVRIWVPNVAMLQVKEMQRSRFWDRLLPNQLNQWRDRRFDASLARKIERLETAMRDGIAANQGATLGVVGKNDCGGWANLLRDMIQHERQIQANPQLERIDFDLGDNGAAPNVGVGDLMVQYFNGSDSNYHGATVVARDGNTLVTLEAHVEKQLKKPEFHFRDGLAGFIQDGNTGRRFGRIRPNMYQAANGQRGYVRPSAARAELALANRRELEELQRMAVEADPNDVNLRALMSVFAVQGGTW